MMVNGWWGVVRWPAIIAAIWLTQAAGPRPEAGIISGVITDSQSNPISRAFVKVVGTTFSSSVLSTEDGKFEVSSVPAGAYHVAVVKPGFPTTWFGTTRINEHGVSVDVDAGERAEIAIQIQRGSVISGVVVDEAGEPVTNAWVWADSSASVSRDGNQPSTVTDRRGRYRLFALRPGEYVVSATADSREVRQIAAGVESVSQYRRAYWPNAVTFRSARRIDVREGQEVAGIDFQLKRTPMAPFHVTQPSGQTPQALDVSVTAVGESEPESPMGSGTDKRYLLPAGTWVLRVLTLTKPGAFAEETFTTDGYSPIEREVALQPAGSISGRLVIDGTLRLNQYLFGAAPVTQDEASWRAGVETGPDEAGAFSIRSLVPGRYSLFAWVFEDRWTVSVRQGDRDIVGPIEIRPGQAVSDITMTLKRRPPASVINGVLLGTAAQPDTSHAVVLINEDERLWNETCGAVRVAQPSHKGRFQFNDLDPGRYRLAATELRRPDCADIPAIRAIVGLGTAVTLAAGETRDFKLIVK